MSKKKIDDNEVYSLTLKGLLYHALISSNGMTEDKRAEHISNSIELYVRRHYAEDGFPAIIFTTGGPVFATVEKPEE